MDKLGYMPKIDFQVGKVVDFPVKSEIAKKQVKKTVAKKTTKVAKKVK
jgi:hypothetical protein